MRCSLLFMYCLKKKIKNESHSSIFIFKNYFITVFSIFSFNKNKLYPNIPLKKKKKKNIQQICEVHILQDLHFSFRLRLVRLKLISGNQFPENRAFGCAVKFGQTENIFSLTGK